MKLTRLMFLLSATLFFQCCFIACANSQRSDTLPFVRTIEINAENIQREKIPFTIENLAPAQVQWQFDLIDSESGSVVESSDEISPEFSLKRGTYDLLITAKGQNTLTRHFRRYITVLPRTFTERNADEVIDLSNVTSPTFLKDYGKKKRPGYRILIKGKYDGRVKITGLRGTKKHPVHIINQGQVEITAANDRSPYAFQFSDDNQYILLDGKADPKIPYGFKIRGHATKSGQILFLGGVFNKGFELCGINLIGNQGVTEGAAALQLQTAYTKECNRDNWNFEYLRVHNNKIERASTEGMYLGYFTDEKRDTGYAPFRLGQVLVYRDSILNAGWDGIQIASADEFEIHDNYIDGASLSGKRNHSSFISWNNGNKEGYCYRNTFKNGAHGANIIFGETGKHAFVYCNLFEEGQFPENITTPAFFYSKVYNNHEDVSISIFHNTIVTSRISAKLDYKNSKTDSGIPVLYAANAILQNRLNLKKYPEIAMGSNFQDSSSWTINNVWRMKEKASELKWDNDFKPMKGSPLLKVNFDIQDHIPKLKGGFYDRDGYPLKHEEEGYTSGCFSAYQLSSGTNTSANGIH